MRTRRYDLTDWLITLVQLSGCALMGMSNVLLSLVGAAVLAVSSAIFILRSNPTAEEKQQRAR